MPAPGFPTPGFRILVKRSASDEGLAVQVGSRRDLPRQHFLSLLDQASSTVRQRLSMENPRSGATVANVLTEVVGGIRTETRKVSDGYARRAPGGAGAAARRPSGRERGLPFRARGPFRADRGRALDAVRHRDRRGRARPAGAGPRDRADPGQARGLLLDRRQGARACSRPPTAGSRRRISTTRSRATTSCRSRPRNACSASIARGCNPSRSPPAPDFTAP